MRRVLLENVFLWVVMTFGPALLMFPFDMDGFLNLSKFLGGIFGAMLSVRVLFALLGHRGDAGGEWHSDDQRSESSVPTVNPSTGSLMLNEHVDIEGRAYGQGYDDD